MALNYPGPSPVASLIPPADARHLSRVQSIEPGIMVVPTRTTEWSGAFSVPAASEDVALDVPVTVRAGVTPAGRPRVRRPCAETAEAANDSGA